MKQIINHSNNGSNKTHEDYKIINIVKSIEYHTNQVEKLNGNLDSIQDQIMLDILEHYKKTYTDETENTLGYELDFILWRLDDTTDHFILDPHPIQLMKAFVYWQKDEELLKQAGNDQVLFKLLKNLSYIPLGV